MTRSGKRSAWDYASYLIMLLLFLGYFFFVKYLLDTGAIQTKDYLTSLTVSFGWVIAFITMLIHLGKTREDTSKAKRDEIRKQLEIGAFKEITAAIRNFSHSITTVSTPYLLWPVELEMYAKSSKVMRPSKADLLNASQQHKITLSRGITDWLLAIEANEIAVVEYTHLRLFIQLEAKEVDDAIAFFSEKISSTSSDKIITEKGIKEFKSDCSTVWKKLHNLSSYLYDYRIELMNQLLSGVFETEVPHRKPSKPEYKTLPELAVPDVVEKRWTAYEEEAAKGKAYQSNSRKESPVPQGPGAGTPTPGPSSPEAP